MRNNLKQLEKIIKNSRKNESSITTKVVIEECEDESSNLQKEDFPPVFDDNSTSVPKISENLRVRSPKGSSISTIISDEKSFESSVSILITDTSNVIPNISHDDIPR